jgi:hypothetical protein
MDYDKILSEGEVWYGFLRISKRLKNKFPKEKEIVRVIYNNKTFLLNYDPKYMRLYGFKKIFKEFKFKPYQKISLRVVWGN